MRTLFMAILVSIPASGVALAQQRPDFSGTWTLPADAPPGPSGKPAPAPGFGPAINIVQDANTITISKSINGQTVHVTHPLDGSESRSRTPGRLCAGESQLIWTASWQGDAIQTAMIGSLAPGADAPSKLDVKALFRLQSPDTLAVDMNFQMRGMKEPRSVTTIYRRSGPPSAAPAAPPKPEVEATIGQIEWLAGTWASATGVEERWTPPAGGSMMAISRTIRNGALFEFEFLCIVERNGGLVYQAMPNGRQPATDFTLRKMEANSLTFENPEHDFPKAIRYTLGADGTLEAVISGDDKAKPITFRFKKQ